MKPKTKKIIAREGLIIIVLILASTVCFQLGSPFSKNFDKNGRRILSKKEVEKFSLFIADVRKVEGFDPDTAIPAQKTTFKLSQVTSEGFDPSTAKPTVDTSPTRQEYQMLAEEELLNRAGFAEAENHIVWDDDLEKRFGVTKGKTVEAYFAKLELVRREMRSWSEEHLAAMAQISFEHFERSLKKIFTGPRPKGTR